MDILQPVYTEKTECQDCYKCVRECPSKAILVENNHAAIIPELCVSCGHCVLVCPSKAKRVRDDLGRAKQLISLGEKVVVSLAPSFKSEFHDTKPEQLISAIKKLGVWAVSETAIGADIVSSYTAVQLQDSRKGNKPLQNGKQQKLFISSACPAAVEYIKKYYPDYSAYIQDCGSPLLSHCRFLKKNLGSEIKIIFIGPCIAKKREADSWEEIELAISFSDLKRWFSEKNIMPALETPGDGESFVPFNSAKGALYPIEGGMIESVNKYTGLEGVNTMAVSGLKNFEQVLANLDNDNLSEPLFLEFLSCQGGCIAGPLGNQADSTALKNLSIKKYAQNLPDTLNTGFDRIQAVLPVAQVPREDFTEEQIQTALRSVGKFSPADEMNCGGCGYDTCRSFSKAMLAGRAEKSMCVSYMRKLAHKKANGLIRAIPSGAVIVDKNMGIIECNEIFAKLLGPEITAMYEAKPGLEGADLSKIVPFYRFFQDVIFEEGLDLLEREVKEGNYTYHVTVFVIEKGESAGGVIQDITDPQMRKGRIVSQARKVISKNLSVVQQIAFLLGENAAETESILNSIIESFGGDFGNGDEDE